jgi:hypothetical protein
MSAPLSTGVTIRIATWNLRRPRNATSTRASKLLEWIQNINADVWVLTETHESIRPGPEYACAATRGSDRTQSSGEQWTMIWSRLPILQSLPTCDPIRTVCARIAIQPTRSCNFYGTVLPWRSDRRWLPKSGGPAFASVLQEQEADWHRLRRDFPSDGFCVAGDFNQELAAKSYAGTALGQRELRRALGAARLYCVSGDEGDPVARITQGTRANIDHICIDTVDGAAWAIPTGAWPTAVDELPGLTDHFGIWADVSY